jgi:hypothetical protein
MQPPHTYRSAGQNKIPPSASRLAGIADQKKWPVFAIDKFWKGPRMSKLIVVFAFFVPACLWL